MDSDTLTKDQILATSESRAAVENEVLIPEVGATHFRFLEHEIRLRALPVYYARQIYKKLEPFRKSMAGAGEGGLTPEQLGALDELTLNSLVEAIDVLREYYQLPTNRDMIEKNASVPEMLLFVDKQLEVSGKSDFMLASLRLITRISGLYGNAVAAALDETSPTASPSSPSATPGELPSTSSSDGTQKVN